MLHHTAQKVAVFGVILVRVFPHYDRIRRDTEYLLAFRPNAEKYGPEQLRIWALFMHCHTQILTTFTLIFVHLYPHYIHIDYLHILLQLTLTCSKSKIETMETFEICSNLTIKTPERRHDMVLVFLLLLFTPFL